MDTHATVVCIQSRALFSGIIFTYISDRKQGSLGGTHKSSASSSSFHFSLYSVFNGNLYCLQRGTKEIEVERQMPLAFDVLAF